MARRIAVPMAVTAAVSALTFSLTAVPAMADSAPANPANPKTPVTVAADALPTAQINGVVWSQVVVDRTVYAAGNFTTARPAGAGAGTNTVTRKHLLSYNIDTGALTTWAPNLNGQALSIAASPDGKRIYVVGDFTQVNGLWRVHIAAFDTATGALATAFAPTLNTTGRAVVASNTTVYAGGDFTSVAAAAGGTAVSRQRVAAFNAATGAPTSLVANANASVTALTLTTDGSKLAIGGRFTAINSSNPYGLSWVNSTTGAVLPLPANNIIRNAGTESSITSLAADSSGVYGTGYHYGGGGNDEGSFRINPSTGALVWVADCHGDSYSVFPSDDEVYVASHHHYCSTIGGYPETNPRSWWYAQAFSKAVTGVNGADPFGEPDHPGQPAPSLGVWFPKFGIGTFTGQYQAGWSVAGNSDYIVYGGEFPTVNGQTQQGLVRFARSGLAPNKRGPQLSAGSWSPTVTSPAAGQAAISFKTNWDQDNESLTYRVYRNAEGTTPIYTTTASGTWWQVSTKSFTDTGQALGSTQKYLVTATDPFGNVAKSNWVSVTIRSSGTTPGGGGATSASDSFTRTVSSGWGSATAGGAWSVNGTASTYAVSGGLGQITLARPSSGPLARLSGVSLRDADLLATFSLNKLTTAGNVQGYLDTRTASFNQSYRTKIVVGPGGSATVQLSRIVGGAETSLGSVAVTGTVSAGSSWRVRTQAQGTGTTTLRVKVWPAGGTEPGSWQLTRTDTASALQGAGGVGLGGYLSSASTSAPITVRFDDLVARPIG